MSFKLKSAHFDGRKVPLWHLQSIIAEETGLDNCCTILIGKNGVGKSRLLGQICLLFDLVSSDVKRSATTNHMKRLLDESKDVQIEYYLQGRLVSLVLRKHRLEYMLDGEEIESLPAGFIPNRVIATTITPFDKFHISEALALPESTDFEDGYKPTFRYLGLKNATGQISKNGQINRVIESLIFSFTKDTENFSKLGGVFAFLGYEATIYIDFQFKVSKKIIEEYLKPVLPDESFDSSKSTIMASLVAKSTVKSSTRSYVEQHAADNPHFYQELGEAVFELLSLTSEPGYGLKTLTLELDFEERKFVSASHNFFKHVTTLKKYGLLSLLDFRLRKLGNNLDTVSIKDGSSGEQSIVLTLLGIASEIEDNSLIVIDEPEISLHPEWQEKFISLMSSIFASYCGCHFVLATHSPQIVAHAAETPCVVVTMDDLNVENAADFFKKSVDFQLVENFNAPGYRNEYLAREGLAAMRLVSQRETQSEDFMKKVELFIKVRPFLKGDDPIAQMADFLIEVGNGFNE